MKEEAFRAWLEARRWNGKPLTSISSRMSKARRFEKAMPALKIGVPDLDRAFETDGMTEVTDRLRDWCREAANTGKAPEELVGQTTNARMRISNVAAAVRNYRQFREAAEKPSSAWPELEELRAAFLDRIPEFERFDQRDNEYERVERQYKDAMIRDVVAIVASGDDDEAAGRRIYRALIPNEGPLLRWQTDDDFARKFPALAPRFYAAVGRLARDKLPISDAIMAAVTDLVAIREAGGTTLTYGQIASIAITVAGMARPTEAAPFKVTKAQELAKLLIGDPIFSGNTLTRDQIERWLQLLQRIEMVMQADWNWAPRDLVDVQGFAWTALDEGWPRENELDDEALLARFDGSALFRAAAKVWTPEQTAAFCEIARVAHGAGLDWYHTNMPRNPVRFGRKPDRDKRARATLGYLDRLTDPRIWLSDKKGRPQVGANSFPLDSANAEKFGELLQQKQDEVAAWEAPTPARPGRWPDEAGLDRSGAEESETTLGDARTVSQPTNLILYGPPGTGKTYTAAREAVRLCDGRELGDPIFAPALRAALMKRYRELVAEERIEFVTFHQSMSYEDFVEGLRPETASMTTGETDETAQASSGGFRLRPRDGIFKQISERARLAPGKDPIPRLDRTRPVFKIALGRRGDEEDRVSEGLDRGLIHLGWGGNIDWLDERYDAFEEIKRHWQQEVDPDATGKDPNIEMMYAFRALMQPGDYIILSDGRDLVRGVAEITGEYFYDVTASYHPHRRAVRWLWQDAAGVPRERFYPRKFRRHSTYQLASEAIDWDALDVIVFGDAVDTGGSGVPHVLVIDEINRANISKVFGELITLLEADKRLGELNELKVRLPYSGSSFGVPTNLHIVGTMNTADRSIALIDKALRRRFTFEEMLPDYEVEGMNEVVDGTGVTLAELLRVINDRIEFLLDREHQIGHGWLLGCKTKAQLDSAMREKVIPLIAEYFFEDWSRAADVLGGQASNPFLEPVTLSPPPGMSDAGPRIRWSLRAIFETNAYTRIVGRG